MAEQDYFKSALSNFMSDVASGGAVCHLADLGHTVRQITEELHFPTPYEKVRQIVWKHYLETAVILLEEPGAGKKNGQYKFIKEQNEYGTTSFRRIMVAEDKGKEISWKTKTFPAEDRDRILNELVGKLSENREVEGYMSCDFGSIRYKDANQYHKLLQMLEPGQREYIEGLPWENRRCYHKLDERMKEILLCLCRQGMYHGTVYFQKLEERIDII